ncbi:MAG TPA: hypothetical protein VMU34_15990 [Mycobacterium sp.]|nr:hypothetical protein [Mycobacterium sp.]
MAPLSRRVIFAGGFATAIAITPAIAVAEGSFAAPRAVADYCANGESMDLYSMRCVPDVLPGVGAPSENTLTECSPDQGQCVANEYYGPAPVPTVDTRVHQSP